MNMPTRIGGQDSSVGIATGYGLHGPAIECHSMSQFIIERK
jgi:hypothetical protein